MTNGRDRVRDGVMGAPKAGLRVIEGGAAEKNAVPATAGRKPRARGGSRAPVPDDPTAENTCPIVALGHRDGAFHFLDAVGQERKLTAKQLGGRADLSGLFVGDTSWLFRWFPKTKVLVSEDEFGNEKTETKVIGMQTAAAGEFLMGLCREAGLYGPHVVLRGAGVWQGENGEPVVHAGDQVRLDGAWRKAGFRTGNQVWVSHPAGPRPDEAGAPATLAQELEARIRELWNFRHSGSSIIVLGLMGIGYFGAAARWRPNGYLIGGTGSGKSLLLDLLRAFVPAHAYTTDTTKSGVENAIDGKPTGVFIDEAGDRVDQRGAQTLLDLVLSAASNEGTKLWRGTADGKGRSAQVLCNVIMATVNPPDMGGGVRDRFTIVDMVKPGAGEDHRAQMEAAIAWAKTRASALWGRALAAWDRWLLARDRFREALARAQCAAREMDQLGAILATWWVLVEDGVPSDAQALDGVGAIGDFVRGAEQVAREDGPRRMLQHLAGSEIQLDRSTDRDLLGHLVERAFATDPNDNPDGARRTLGRYGIRVILASDEKDRQGRPIPRAGQGDGLWFGRAMPTLRGLFANTVWDGERWTYEMLRLESARKSGKNVRIGNVPPAPAIWLSRADWDPPDD